MKRVFFKLCGFITFFMSMTAAFAQTKPLYRLPETLPGKSDGNDYPLLAGTDAGLFKILPSGIPEALWIDGRVERILKTKDTFFLVTSEGIFASSDLKNFEERNKGLPFLTVKTYNPETKAKTLVQQAALLKDICADPVDPNVLVTATKDAVYLTRDAGKTWKSLGSMSRNSSGMKAVAAAHMPIYSETGAIKGTELVIFMSHPIYGFSYYRADTANPKWTDVSSGFAIMPSLTQPDEIADILPVLCEDEKGTLYCEIYASQTFIPNVYRFDWKTKKAVRVYQGSEPCDTIDGLWQSESKIVFTMPGKFSTLSLSANTVSDIEEKTYAWTSLIHSPHSVLNCAFVPKSLSGFSTSLCLNELWLLKPDTSLSPYHGIADGKKAVYSSVYQMRNMEGISKYRKILKDNKLNALVVDMKDDYGLLRFDPKTELLKEKGKVTQYKIDVDKFVKEYKKDGTYLIGRIVVFKDRNLAKYGNGKYAVWDSENKIPWVGIKGVEDEETVYYDENWVDPYSEEVWEYNVQIAKELIERGFDEVQFDYIRFPTDGTNLGNASYRWRDKGMDKESALISFLSYARQNINAPIGIDIYGANGWYRTGARTGQDVELMSHYVDVICPMYYPSHFEQNFLEYAPFAERPYRIYFFGSYRNTVIGRNRIIIRPWVQAFYMGVRYDKAYYNKDYVKREIYGVRDGLNRGYMYWNNSGGWYDDISPDINDDDVSPWTQNEADLQKRLPAFSSGKPASKIPNDPLSIKNKSDAMISILNTVLEQEWEEPESKRVSSNPNLLIVEPFPQAKQ